MFIPQVLLTKLSFSAICLYCWCFFYDKAPRNHILQTTRTLRWRTRIFRERKPFRLRACRHVWMNYFMFTMHWSSWKTNFEKEMDPVKISSLSYKLFCYSYSSLSSITFSNLAKISNEDLPTKPRLSAVQYQPWQIIFFNRKKEKHQAVKVPRSKTKDWLMSNSP